MAHATSVSYFDRQHVSRYNRSDAQPSTAMSRKRPRVESPRSSQFLSRPERGLDASTSSFDLASPAPLANSDYFLFGGLDTPGTWSEHRIERTHEIDAEQDYRHSRFTQKLAAPELSFADLRERFGGPDNSSQVMVQRDQSWGIRKAAWALTGRLAGKIISFCWNTTFRGFRAGGGQAYTDKAQAVPSHEQSQHDAYRRRSIDDDFSPVNSPHRSTFNLTRETDGHSSHRPVRPLLEDSVVKNSWVLIDHSSSTAGDQSPVRKKSRASIAGTSRPSAMGPPPSQPQFSRSTSTYTASFASPRSRSMSIRQSSANSVHTKRSRPLVTTPSKRQSQTSFIPQQSPISPEVEAYQRKKRREEKKHDESIQRLNAQLQDMIREGQQALGSKIEIFDDTDEGYFDDEYRLYGMK